MREPLAQRVIEAVLPEIMFKRADHARSALEEAFGRLRQIADKPDEPFIGDAGRSMADAPT